MKAPRAFLVTTAKNEAPYFLEWVAHHLEIGFTDIIIYQNDSDDLTHETLSTLRRIGAIQYFYNRAVRGRHQVRAYERCCTLPAYSECDWAMALDLDEFLVVKTGNGTLTDLLAAAPESDCLHLNWRIFGHSGYETLTDQLVMERFSMANYQLGKPDYFGAFKCLFRPNLFRRPGVHRPKTALVPPETLRFCNGSGLTQPDYKIMNYNSTDPSGCSLAQINHYIVRDMASFMLKSVRGSAHQADRKIGHRYWTMRNTNFEVDDSAQPWLARVAARMDALDKQSKGRLMELREAAIYTHMARYYTMLQDPAMRAFRRFLKDNPNAMDHRKLKAEKAREASKAAADAPPPQARPAPARTTARKPAPKKAVAATSKVPAESRSKATT